MHSERFTLMASLAAGVDCVQSDGHVAFPPGVLTNGRISKSVDVHLRALPVYMGACPYGMAQLISSFFPERSSVALTL